MAYHVYTTEGIVLQGFSRGDADKHYIIFTKELGVVSATAKSARKIASKLRFALDDYSRSELSFVRGKREWKITHAREIGNTVKVLRHEQEKRKAALRIMRLLKTLVIGEGSEHALFSSVTGALSFLASAPLGKEEVAAFERIATLRILALLGYGTSFPAYAPFVDTSVWSDYLIRDAMPNLPRMTEDINAALEATQLSTLVY